MKFSIMLNLFNIRLHFNHYRSCMKMKVLDALFSLYSIYSLLPSENFERGLGLPLIKSDLDEVIFCHDETPAVHILELNAHPFVRLNVLGSNVLFKHVKDGDEHVFETHGKVSLYDRRSQKSKTMILQYKQGNFYPSDHSECLKSSEDWSITGIQPYNNPPEEYILELRYTASSDIKKAVNEKLDKNGPIYGNIVERYNRGEKNPIEDQLQVGDELLTVFYSTEPRFYNPSKFKLYINFPREAKVLLLPIAGKKSSKEVFKTGRFPGLVFDLDVGNFIGPEYTWFLVHPPPPQNKMLGFRFFPHCYKSHSEDAAISHLPTEVKINVLRLSEDIAFSRPSCLEHRLGVVQYMEDSKTIVFCQRENLDLCENVEIDGEYCVKTRIGINGDEADLIVYQKTGRLDYLGIGSGQKTAKELPYYEGVTLHMLKSPRDVPVDAVIEKIVDYVEIPKLERVFRHFTADMHQRTCLDITSDDIAVILYYRGVKTVFRCSTPNIGKLLYLDWYGISGVVDTNDFKYDELKVLDGNVTYNVEKKIFQSNDRMYVGMRAIFVRTDINDDKNVEIPLDKLQDELQELRSKVVTLIGQGKEHTHAILRIGERELVCVESLSNGVTRMSGKFKVVSDQNKNEVKDYVYSQGNNYVEINSHDRDNNRYNVKYGVIDTPGIGYEIYFAKLRDVDTIVKRTISDLFEDYCLENFEHDNEIRVDIELKKHFYLEGRFYCESRSFVTDNIKSSAITISKTLYLVSGDVKNFQAKLTFKPDVMFAEFIEDPVDIYAFKIPEKSEWVVGNKVSKSLDLVVGTKKSTYLYYVY